jgi:DinB superfamily
VNEDIAVNNSYNLNHMDTGKWFDRKFDFNFGVDAYSNIYQRLQKAPDILQQLVLHLPEPMLVQQPQCKWSIKEHAGHLSVLEPVWRIRWHEILEKKPVLTAADLNNAATTEAGFNRYSISSLVERFLDERSQSLALLDGVDVLDENLTSMHPRLQQPMRVIDLASFVADHDEHHLEAIKEIIRALREGPKMV